MYRHAKNFYFKYEKYLSPLALIAGFTIDNLTLRRIDLWAENALFVAYLFFAFLCVVFLTLLEAGRVKRRFLVETVGNFAPFVLQLVYGGLFSAFLVFYSRSGSVVASWPFLFILAGLLIGNELMRKRYLRLTFRLCVFYLAVFSYLVFALPIAVNKIGVDIFLLSGFLSLVLFFLVAFLFYKITPGIFKISKMPLFFSVFGVYLLFNFLYFTNFIPPLPLALKDGGIFHLVLKLNGNYETQCELPKWYEFWRDCGSTIYLQKGKPVYSFSAVFSPADLNTNIYHQWFFYDEEKGEWTEQGKLGFPIFGGREKGYRGYTVKYNVWPGKWRVDFITERGQVLGRNNFIIVFTEEASDLKSQIF